MCFTSSLWRNRDVWIVVLARAVSLLGDEAAVVALTLRLHDSGGGSGAIAALFVAGLLPLVICAPLAGRLVDRYDSRYLLGWSGSAQAGLCAALAMVQSTPAVPGPVFAPGGRPARNGASWETLAARHSGGGPATAAA